MTDQQRAYWQAYVDSLKPVLRVSDWIITVESLPADSDAEAQMWFKRNQPFVELRLGAKWESYSRDHQRQTIAHELLHCHTHHPWEAVNRVTELLGNQAESLADEMICQRLEFMVDQLAYTLAPFLPLPPKVKREKKAA